MSIFTAWELAVLVTKGRLDLAFDLHEMLSSIKRTDELEFVPVDEDIAIASVDLPGEFHAILPTASSWPRRASSARHWSRPTRRFSPIAM